MPENTITFAANDQEIKRSDLVGRLSSFPTTKNARLTKSDFAKAFQISFPAMPDSLELARKADYAVETSPDTPDGIHVYRKTEHLEIPFSFRLHAFDRYCPQGSLTILQVAARLHAFILPINVGGDATINVVGKAGEEIKPAPNNSVLPLRNNRDLARAGVAPNNFGIAQFLIDPETPTDPKLKTVQKSGNENSLGHDADSRKYAYNFANKRSSPPYPPLTAWLDIIFAGNNQVGISCQGYIREVSVKLNGPWLRGPNQSFNLPTSADYSFVFVHRPGYGNGRDLTASFNQTDAYAKDVRDRLYDTFDLTEMGDYQGFDAAPPAAPAPAQISNAPQLNTPQATQSTGPNPPFTFDIRDTFTRLPVLNKPVDSLIPQKPVTP